MGLFCYRIAIVRERSGVNGHVQLGMHAKVSVCLVDIGGRYVSVSGVINVLVKERLTMPQFLMCGVTRVSLFPHSNCVLPGCRWARHGLNHDESPYLS